MQVVLKHGKQPTTVVVDLPCTLFMLDNRKLPIIEKIARLLAFSPKISVWLRLFIYASLCVQLLCVRQPRSRCVNALRDAEWL
jgi:hypothetical protein